MAPSLTRLLIVLWTLFSLPGNRRGANDDRVARHDLELLMIAYGHARKAAHRLALRSRRHDDDLLGRVRVDVLDPDDRLPGNP